MKPVVCEELKNVCPSQKDKYHMISFICGSKKVEPIEVESSMVIIRDEGE
jgi:hypothetical protein